MQYLRRWELSEVKFTEEQLKLYALPLSENENNMCLHAIKAIRDALKQLGFHTDNEDVIPLEKDTYSYAVTLKKYYSKEEIEIFIQGSYANNTCVRGESDVDIAVVRKDKYEYAFGKEFSPYVPGFTHNTEAAEFKSVIERVLKDYFTTPYVHRKNKSIKVDGNSYRKQADTVPAFGMHYFYNSEMNDYASFLEGITIYADNGQTINNFPKQHISNGRSKNVRTNHYYKKMVRIAKKLRYMMEELGYSGARKVSSFGVESLLWNIPDDVFRKYITYRLAFDEVVDYLYNNKIQLYSYKEANGIKDLCPDLSSRQDFAEFIDELHRFYDYDI
jgi:hypothetical protein